MDTLKHMTVRCCVYDENKEFNVYTTESEYGLIAALYSWIYRTDEFTEQSYIKYISSKGIPATTKEGNEQLKRDPELQALIGAFPFIK